MKTSFKPLFECLAIFVCGVAAVSAAAEKHWAVDGLIVFAALMISVTSFLDYRTDYRLNPPTGGMLRWPEHYAIEILKSFMLFTCGEGVAFEFTRGAVLVGAAFLFCAALICFLVLRRARLAPLSVLS